MAGKGGAGKGAAKPAGAGQRGARPIIIRKEEIIEGGHHGGAWKVAYADFVTAMMAFFLLMWLINATTQDQRRGIAAYFSPMAKIESGFSSTGMIPGGAAPVSDGAQLVDQGPAQLATLEAHGDTSKQDNDGDPDTGPSDTAPVGAPGVAAVASSRTVSPPLPAQATPTPVTPAAAALDDASRTDTNSAAANAQSEDKALHDAARKLRDAVSGDPTLAAVSGQMAIDVTSDGLRIQIMDAEHRPMFQTGSSVPTAYAQGLLRIAAHFVAQLPESVSIGGYTDAAPYRSGQISNWSLSSERADTARNILVEAGLPDARLSDVTGFADRKLLLPGDPLSPANRRIVLTLRRKWQHAPNVAASGAP